MLCVLILYMNCGIYSLKSTPNDRFLRSFSYQFNLPGVWTVFLRLPTKLHTCIIGYYNPSVRIMDLASHTFNVVCVNFRHEWRGQGLQFIWQFYLLWEQSLPRNIFSYYILLEMSVRGFDRWSLHYLLDYGDCKLHSMYVIVKFKIYVRVCKYIDNSSVVSLNYIVIVISILYRIYICKFARPNLKGLFLIAHFGNIIFKQTCLLQFISIFSFHFHC